MGAVQGTVSAGLDWPAIALVVLTGALALATLYLAWQTRNSVAEIAKSASAAQAEAKATLALVEEARKDRELAVQPVIVLGDPQGDTEMAGRSVPQVQVRNVGRAPALTVRLLRNWGGEVCWSQDFRVVPPEGEVFQRDSPAYDAQTFLLFGHGDPSTVEPGVIHESEDVVAYCRDQLGNGLRFALRNAEPPEVWRRGDKPPRWASALEQALDLRRANQ